MRRLSLSDRERVFMTLKAQRDRAALRESYRRCVLDLQTKAAELSLAARLMADELTRIGAG